MGNAKPHSEFNELPLEKDEVLFERPGAVMALKVDPLNQAPVFVVESVATTVSSTMNDAKAWGAQQVAEGSQLVFVLGREGWHLQGAESDFPFSQAQVESFFSQMLLQDLWLSHHPVASARKRYLETLKGKGVH
ncbi:hypothetical protein HZA44_04525 [Candidatus Peregrinibacteria bacterium]|nr:hypothetical protein [Candidatus Peregrinibacteria bacterium]